MYIMLYYIASNTFLIFEPLIHTLLLLVPVYMYGTRSKSYPFLYYMLFFIQKMLKLYILIKNLESSLL